MIATKDSFEPHSGESRLAGPNSKKIYLEGTLHKEVRVPMREIELTPTKTFNGAIEANDPVRVYDCSGPWGDPDVHRQGRGRAARVAREMDSRPRRC